MDTNDVARLIYHLVNKSDAVVNPSLSEDGNRVSFTIDHGGRLLRASVLVEDVRPLPFPTTIGA